MDFVDVAGTGEIAAGEMKSFNVEGSSVLVANCGGDYCAIGNKCTHRGGDLSKGRLEGNIVTCPRHGSQFDLKTGKSIVGPKVGLVRLSTKDEPVYQVKVEGERIKVGL